ncbi:MAG TPA: hypothetical protein VHA07_09395 [Devosia sp.]|nr:hypothetical protein [Devosia sp.]
MIRALLVLLALLPLPAAAAGWGHYVNARYGYAIDVPPGFSPQGESANGDGQVFRAPGATLAVYGAAVAAADFEMEVVARERLAEQAGWAITYAVSTPQKASFSGRRGGRILYVRMIALCGGAQLAAFELQYGAAELHTFNPVVDRLLAALRPTQGACP